ncbi:MAG: helix-turn-helix transcriptional regulator [Methylophilaceae bacterium]|nr:helix-turn-helix transcriptional regulator [Methylophilaceae bacterium]
MISSSQVRAAKALLRWSGEELAIRSGISLSTIRRVEGADGIPEAQNIKTIMAIKKALEDAGVEFVGTPDDRPGVRLK